MERSILINPQQIVKISLYYETECEHWEYVPAQKEKYFLFGLKRVQAKEEGWIDTSILWRDEVRSTEHLLKKGYKVIKKKDETKVVELATAYINFSDGSNFNQRFESDEDMDSWIESLAKTSEIILVKMPKK